MSRKAMGLKRRDRIMLEISVSDANVANAVKADAKFVQDRVGVSQMTVHDKLGVRNSWLYLEPKKKAPPAATFLFGGGNGRDCERLWRGKKTPQKKNRFLTDRCMLCIGIKCS
jgi:hypothetical protein